MTLLTRRTMLYAELEPSYGAAASFNDATSAVLVENADYSLDMQFIERNLYRNDLSPIASVVGRKIGKIKFTHEIRGGGQVGSECRLGRLLRACAMEAVATGAAWFGDFHAIGSPASPVVSWVGGGSMNNTEPKTLVITVTTGGASGTAVVSIASDDGDSAQTGEVLTSGTPVTVTTGGFSAATITPTWTGNLVVGQVWVVTVFPPGIKYLPVSDIEDMASISLRLYKDGIRHDLTGAYGTFKINTQAGQLGKVDFEFTGLYNAVIDSALPTNAVFETTIPQQVELGRLHIDSFGIEAPNGSAACVVDMFSFDIVNEIVPRTSINHADGLIGLRIVGRQSTGGIDPEATLVATQDFWGKLAVAKQMPFGMRVGTSSGNMWAISAPSCQYTGLTYKDRNGLVALDAGLKFNRVNGDDEIMLYAC